MKRKHDPKLFKKRSDPFWYNRRSNKDAFRHRPRFIGSITALNLTPTTFAMVSKVESKPAPVNLGTKKDFEGVSVLLLLLLCFCHALFRPANKSRFLFFKDLDTNLFSIYNT